MTRRKVGNTNLLQRIRSLVGGNVQWEEVKLAIQTCFKVDEAMFESKDEKTWSWQYQTASGKRLEPPVGLGGIREAYTIWCSFLNYMDELQMKWNANEKVPRSKKSDELQMSGVYINNSQGALNLRIEQISHVTVTRLSRSLSLLDLWKWKQCFSSFVSFRRNP